MHRYLAAGRDENLTFRVLHQTVSDPKLRHENTRSGGIFFYLLPQLAYEYSKVMGILRMPDAPDCFQQMLMRNDIARMLGENLQQPILLR